MLLMSDPLRGRVRDCEDAAHEDGFVAGLRLALSDADEFDAPGRVAALPADRVGPGAIVVAHRMADDEGVAFVRTAGGRPDGQRAEVAAELAAARLGTARRLVEHATEHLGTRTGGGEPLLRKQLIIGMLADLQTAIEVLRRTITAARHVPAALVDVHDRLTVAEWEAATLLGASGYVSGGPSWGAYVSRLAANCWIDRRGTPCLS